MGALFSKLHLGNTWFGSSSSPQKGCKKMKLHCAQSRVTMFFNHTSSAFVQSSRGFSTSPSVYNNSETITTSVKCLNHKLTVCNAQLTALHSPYFGELCSKIQKFKKVIPNFDNLSPSTYCAHHRCRTVQTNAITSQLSEIYHGAHYSKRFLN